MKVEMRKVECWYLFRIIHLIHSQIVNIKITEIKREIVEMPKLPMISGDAKTPNGNDYVKKYVL